MIYYFINAPSRILQAFFDQFYWCGLPSVVQTTFQIRQQPRVSKHLFSVPSIVSLLDVYPGLSSFSTLMDVGCCFGILTAYLY